MKQKKAAVAVTVGLVGVLALGACSSNASDQVQDSNSPSSAQSETPREAAKADNSKNVTVPASKGGMFSDVVLTQAPQTKCTRTEKTNDKNVDVLSIKCTNVVLSVLGDSVYVELPGKGYIVEVNNDTVGKSNMQTTQRDYAASAIAYSRENHKVWSTPDIWSAGEGWAVGADSRTVTPINVTITVKRG